MHRQSKIKDFNNPIRKMSKTSTIAEYLEITLGVCSGKPRIAGNPIRVQDIEI